MKELKDEILACALQLAQEEGWENVTTRRITGKFGYSTSAIYYHIGSKEGILIELQKQGFLMLRDEMKLAAEKYSVTPESRLIAVSIAFWEFAHRHRPLYELMFGLANVSCDSQSGDEIRQAGKVVQDVLAHFPEKNVFSLFTNWWALVQGFVCISFAGSSADDRLFGVFKEGLQRYIKAIK